MPKQGTSSRSASKRQYWIWVTGPDYYLDPDGSERAILEPAAHEDGLTWSCHEATRRGDLILLYRKKQKKDIAYLLRAETGAFSLRKVDLSRPAPWPYGCEYRSLERFRTPLPLDVIKADSVLKEGRAVAGNFQGTAFRLEPREWRRTTALLDRRNPGYAKRLERWERQRVQKEFVVEELLEQAVADNLDALKDYGYNLELYVDPKTERIGRQFPAPEAGGRIDLLCVTKRRPRRFVVIELKVRPAKAEAAGQLKAYMAWVRRNLGRRVDGLIISPGTHPSFDYGPTHGIDQIDLDELPL